MFRKILYIKKAQIFTEYVLLIGIVFLGLLAMAPLVKRGSQGLIKVVADELGSQEGAEQKFDDRGHLKTQYVVTRSDTNKSNVDTLGTVQYVYQDTVDIGVEVDINLGLKNRN